VIARSQMVKRIRFPTNPPATACRTHPILFRAGLFSCVVLMESVVQSLYVARVSVIRIIYVALTSVYPSFVLRARCGCEH